MSDYERLKTRLDATPYLVVDRPSARIELIDGARVNELMAAVDPFPTRIILNLQSSLEGFADLPAVGRTDRDFGLRDIAKIAGMSYQLAYFYLGRGVFVPTRAATGSGRGEVEARFDWRGAFIAGVAGCLRRHGMRPDQLQCVHALFAGAGMKQAAAN